MVLKPTAVVPSAVVFDKSPEAGVPRAGVTNVGLFDRTTAPVPVEDVTPVPPFATATVPVTFVALPLMFIGAVPDKLEVRCAMLALR